MNAPDDSHDDKFGLLMPFVVVASKGGPYDDDAYVAGYELGQTAALLESRQPWIQCTVHAENVPQLDLVAMRSGYTLDASEPMLGWAIATFTRAVSPDSTEPPERR